jgi:hypothetical protein
VQAGESDLVSPVRYRLGGGREFPTDGSRLPDAGVGGDGGGDEGEEKERKKIEKPVEDVSLLLKTVPT